MQRQFFFTIFNASLAVFLLACLARGVREEEEQDAAEPDATQEKDGVQVELQLALLHEVLKRAITIDDDITSLGGHATRVRNLKALLSGRDRWKQNDTSRGADFGETSASLGIENIDAILERLKSSTSEKEENVRAYAGSNKPRATVFGNVRKSQLDTWLASLAKRAKKPNKKQIEYIYSASLIALCWKRQKRTPTT